MHRRSSRAPSDESLQFVKHRARRRLHRTAVGSCINSPCRSARVQRDSTSWNYWSATAGVSIVSRTLDLYANQPAHRADCSLLRVSGKLGVPRMIVCDSTQLRSAFGWSEESRLGHFAGRDFEQFMGATKEKGGAVVSLK